VVGVSGADPGVPGDYESYAEGRTVELEVAFFEAAFDPEVGVARATAPDPAGGSDGGG
jgi:hypothetical protein